MSVDVVEEILSTRPYLLRAFYDWIVDNGWTPYIVVYAYGEGVLVPQQYIDKEGKIVLNISMVAVKNLVLGNEALEFEARFSGMPMQVYVPMVAIEAVYARENGRGVVFSGDENGDTPPSSPPPSNKEPTQTSGGSAPRAEKPKKPSLKLIK